jgi:hypothetical protein
VQQSQGSPTWIDLEIRCGQAQEELTALREENVATTWRHDQEQQLFATRYSDLEKTCMELQAELQNVRDGMSNKERIYNMEVEHLQLEVHRWKQEFDRLQQKINFVKETPIGIRRRARTLRGIDELNPGTGGAKRRVKLMRTVLQPHVVETVNDCNRVQRGRKRLHGDKESQTKTAVALAKILSRHESLTLATHPAMGHVETKIANKVLKSIGDSVGPDKILAACDQAGVSHRGYGAIYKAVKGPIELLNKDIKAKILPNPYQVKLLRKELNANLPQFVGEYYHIEGRMTLPTTSKTTKKCDDRPKDVVLNDKNSLFTDLEVVQQSMVIFYDITVAGTVVP